MNKNPEDGKYEKDIRNFDKEKSTLYRKIQNEYNQL